MEVDRYSVSIIEPYKTSGYMEGFILRIIGNQCIVFQTKEYPPRGRKDTLYELNATFSGIKFGGPNFISADTKRQEMVFILKPRYVGGNFDNIETQQIGINGFICIQQYEEDKNEPELMKDAKFVLAGMLSKV